MSTSHEGTIPSSEPSPSPKSSTENTSSAPGESKNSDDKPKKKKKKKFHKRALKFILTHSMGFLSILANLMVYALFRSCTIRWYKIERIEKLHRDGYGIIYAFFHQRIILYAYSHGRMQVHCMVSAHRDARIIANILKGFGHKPVYGSSTRGGGAALQACLDGLKKRCDIAIAADGPKGPAGIIKPGAIVLAQRSGSPILPAAWSCDKFWTFPTWDKFTLPKPFSHIALVAAEPMFIPKETTPEEFEEYRLEVERRIHEVTEISTELANNPQPGGRTGKHYFRPPMDKD